jgi:L-ascorbate metabolism protein UlaG (beta-lactamase superfamily)
VKSAYQKDDAFLAEVRVAEASPDVLQVWWLGQSGFLLAWNGIHVLLDPYLSDSLTEKYKSTDKPHERITERVVDPARLNFIDVATSTHNHTDHLDAATLLPLMDVNPGMRLIIPEANRDFVSKRLDCDPAWPIGLDAGQQVDAAGVTISAVPAAHETLDRDEQGRHVYLGYVLQIGPISLYHSGDTVLYDGMVDWLRPFNLDLAVLPINGSRPERRVSGNLDGAEAAQLGKDIGAKLVVPCHYDMFAFNTESPELFEETCRELGQPFRVLRNGEGLSIIPR